MTTNEIMALAERMAYVYANEYTHATCPAAAEHEALRSAIEALQADARRYRWLQYSKWTESAYPDVWREITNDYGGLDAAIDAAMALDKS
jgi:hypothetical protein